MRQRTRGHSCVSKAYPKGQVTHALLFVALPLTEWSHSSSRISMEPFWWWEDFRSNIPSLVAYTQMRLCDILSQMSLLSLIGLAV